MYGMKICLVYTLAPVGKGIYRKLKVPISRIDGEKISCLPHTYIYGFTNSEISNLESRLFKVRQDCFDAKNIYYWANKIDLELAMLNS